MVKTFLEYFPQQEDYPDLSGAEILPLGTHHEYISSCFLNGLINYQDIKKAFLVGHYNPINDAEFNKITTSPQTHTDFSELENDVVILSEKDGIYWHYWYDRDVSDCCIGRFKTDDSLEVVIEKFDKYIKEQPEYIHEHGIKEIPLNYFSGWISG